MKYALATGAVLVVTGAALIGCRPKTEEGSARQAERHSSRIVEMITGELDLAQNQQVILNGIAKEFLARRGEVKDLRKGFMDDAAALLDKDTVTEDELNALFTAREEQVKELRRFAVAQYVRFHNALTKEQKLELKKKMEKFRNRRG